MANAENDRKRRHNRYTNFPYLAISFILVSAFAHAQQNNYAVVVGIAGYPNFAQADRLKYSDRDAEKFYNFILSPQGGGFLKSNVHLVRNSDATHQRIAKEIEWLGQHTPVERAYIFFAGHGVTDGRGLAYFMPWDGDPTSPSAEGFRTDRFLEDVRDTITAETLVVFIDACHAASAFSAGRRGPENIAGTILQEWSNDFSAPKEEVRMVFLAAASNESALEDDELKAGLFTYYLMKGLSGEADTDKDGKVTALELRNYIGDEVAKRALDKFKAHQDPMLSPGFYPDLTLSILGYATTGTNWKPQIHKVPSQSPPARQIDTAQGSPDTTRNPETTIQGSEPSTIRSAPVVGMAGTWSGEYTLLPNKGSRPEYITLDLQQSGPSISGTLTLTTNNEEQNVKGMLRDNGDFDITAFATHADPFNMVFRGHFSAAGGSSVNGNIEASGTNPYGKFFRFPGTFSLTRSTE